MKTINLLPQEAKKEHRYELLSHQIAAFWMWTVASILLLYIVALGTKIYLDRIISSTQQQIADSKKLLTSSDYKDLQDKILILNSNIREIGVLQSQHYYWSKALVALAGLIPPDVQLSQTTIDRQTGRVDINGQAQNRESVLTLWANVIHSEYFKNINFPLSNLEKPKAVNFNYTFYVNKDKVKTP